MYRKGNNLFLKHWDFILADLICLQVSFYLAYVLRHGWHNPYEIGIYRSISLFMVLFYICAAFVLSPHSGVLRRGYFEEYKSVVKLMSALVLLCFAYMFFMQEGDAFSRVVFAELWGLGIIIMYLVRIGLKRIVQRMVSKGIPKREVILISDYATAEKTMRDIRAITYRDYHVSGVILVDGEVATSVLHVPVVATLSNALEFLRNSVVDEVLVDLPKELNLPESVISGCLTMGITVHLNLMLMSHIGGQKMIEQFGDYTVLTTSVRMTSPKHMFYKRCLDVLGGIAGLILTGILFIFVAPIIYVQSPGPIFFSQYRVGMNGRKFKIYKFRSMYMDAEERKKELMAQNEVKGLMFKMENDPRIFPFGNFIRKTSIDEFPQFLNVLKGEMSLVGTRPPLESETNLYELHHRARLAIKPGITGMWQVSGRSKIIDFEEVVRLDKEYIENWTLGLDIKILFKTVAVVLGKKGSM